MLKGDEGRIGEEGGGGGSGRDAKKGEEVNGVGRHGRRKKKWRGERERVGIGKAGRTGQPLEESTGRRGTEGRKKEGGGGGGETEGQQRGQSGVNLS